MDKENEKNNFVAPEAGDVRIVDKSTKIFDLVYLAICSIFVFMRRCIISSHTFRY